MDYYQQARQDAVERWNVGNVSEWPEVTGADDVFAILREQAQANCWDDDIEQTSADADVIYDYLIEQRGV